MTDYKIRVPGELALDDDLVVQAQREICARRPNRMGTRSGVWFLDDKAIRSPIRDDRFFERYATSQNAQLDYLREAFILRDLEKNEISVPHVYGLHHCEGKEAPILIMEKLDIQQIDSQDMCAREKHCALIEKVEHLGYLPRDAFFNGHNCGITLDGKVYIFDFEVWGTPERIRSGIRSCLEESAEPILSH